MRSCCQDAVRSVRGGGKLLDSPSDLYVVTRLWSLPPKPFSSRLRPRRYPFLPPRFFAAYLCIGHIHRHTGIIQL